MPGSQLQLLAAAVQQEADRRQPFLLRRILSACNLVEITVTYSYRTYDWWFESGECYLARILSRAGNYLELQLEFMLTVSYRWNGPVHVRSVPADCFEVTDCG